MLHMNITVLEFKGVHNQLISTM